MRAYRAAHSVRIAECKKQWKLNNQEHVKEKDRTYAQANPEKKRIARKKWEQNNPEKFKASKIKYSSSYPEKVRAAKNAWTCKNIPKRRAGYAKRRAAKRNAIPKWVTAEEWFLIQEAYGLAKLREIATGYKWQVDHVIPLQNSLVCGLHVIENLQVIPAIINAQKGNKYIIE